MKHKSSSFTFNVIQRTTQGQTEMLFKKHLIVLVSLTYGYGAYPNYFQAYFMYVHYFSPRDFLTNEYHR